MILYYAKLDNLDYFIAKLDSLAYFIDKLDSLDYFIAKWDILVDNIHKLYLPLTNINSVSPACEYLVEQHYGGKGYGSLGAKAYWKRQRGALLGCQ
jgi:hypothetical protein